MLFGPRESNEEVAISDFPAVPDASVFTLNCAHNVPAPSLDSPGHRRDPQREDLEEEVAVTGFESPESFKGTTIV